MCVRRARSTRFTHRRATATPGAYVPQQQWARTCSNTTANPTLTPAPGCVDDAFNFARPFNVMLPPAAAGATCSANAPADKTKVATSSFTLCAPTPACEDSVCAGAALGQLQACIVADGEVPCPTARFTQKMPIGSALGAVTCASCSCSVTTEACDGVLTVYTAKASKGSGGRLTWSWSTVSGVLLVPGACTNVNVSSYSSYKYVPAPTATTALDGEHDDYILANGITFIIPADSQCEGLRRPTRRRDIGGLRPQDRRDHGRRGPDRLPRAVSADHLINLAFRAMAEPRPSGWIGSIFQDRWRIDAKIARGGVATVFKASERGGPKVAIKIMHPEFARNLDARGRFLREGYVANKVGHPMVVKVVADGATPDGSASSS